MAERINFARTKNVFRTNFEGRDGRDRELSIEIQDEDQAKEMLEQGFNVKQTQPMDVLRYNELAEKNEWERTYEEYLAEFESRWYITCTLAKNGNLPKEFVKIYLINEDNGVATHVDNTDSNAIKNLDIVYPDFIDVVASVYDWTYQGRSGKKLYISSIYLHYHLQNNDPFAYQVQKRKEDEIEMPFD